MKFLAVVVVLGAAFAALMAYAAERGEADRLEHTTGQDCAVVWVGPWFDVECGPQP